jgi:hypothetical protein
MKQTNLNIAFYMISVAQSLRYYATSWKVAGSRPYEVNDVFIYLFIYFFFSIYLTLPAALDPGVYSASNINEYKKQKNNISGEQSSRGVQLTTIPPSVSCLDNVGSLTSHNFLACTAC